jgi:hypothetical protein
MDFRSDQVLAARNYGFFCTVSAAIIGNAQAFFVKDQFISAEALSRK